jgi:hypothetical protein
VLVAGAVVDNRFPLDGLLGNVQRDVEGLVSCPWSVVRCFGEDGDFKSGQGAPCVAVGHGGPEIQGVVVELDFEIAKAAVFVGDGALEEGFDVVFAQGGELEDLAAADQGGVDGEEWVFGGCADEEDLAVFHVGEEDVLLGAVEAMYLVEKENGALAVEAEALLGVVDDFADFLDADGGGVELLEVGFAVVGNERARVVLPVPGGP